MSDENAFINTLKANPTDQNTRLVYADWLDDHDRPEEAEYLRGVSRLAVVEFDSDEGKLLEPRIRELEESLPSSWTTASAAAFEIGFLGISLWTTELRSMLESEFRTDIHEHIVLLRNAPAVLLDRLRPIEALDFANGFYERLNAVVHRDSERNLSEYLRERRELFTAQTGPGTVFKARPTDVVMAPPLNRFEVVAVGLFEWNSSLSDQNPNYLAEPLCELMGMSQDNAIALLYSGAPFSVRSGLSFVSAVEAFRSLRKRVKRHHLARALDEAVRLGIRACGEENNSMDLDTTAYGSDS